MRALDRVGLGERERLALHRSFHTAGLELADRADDSYGVVGELRREAWHSYLRLDWRATGMAPEHYWADLCDLVVFEVYALEYQEETLPWTRVPANTLSTTKLVARTDRSTRRRPSGKKNGRLSQRGLPTWRDAGTELVLAAR